jgi:hypothetical protein
MATCAQSPLIATLLAAFAFAMNAPAAELPPPGTVLSEGSKELGFGFREVHRSKVNSPGQFEGVGHFSFVYFGDELLCQCNHTEIVISPDGKRSIFVNAEDGKLTLFESTSHKRRLLSQQFIGHPARAEWREAEVVLTLVRYENGATLKSTLNISL